MLDAIEVKHDGGSRNVITEQKQTESQRTSAPTARCGTTIRCHCGQELDRPERTNCPRCGTAVHRH
jgi:hypothetical protein